MTQTLELAPWAGNDVDVDRSLRCVRVEPTTRDVKTFIFEPAEAALLDFTPGQYLTLTMQIGGRSLSRCYSISSAPTGNRQLAITVKRVRGGIVSNWLHDQLGPGGTVSACGPLGGFSIAEHPAGKYLFLSAGSGITPLMSMTRALLNGADRPGSEQTGWERAGWERPGWDQTGWERAARERADVVFIHNAHTPEDLIFRRELESISPDTGIRVELACSADPAGQPWAGHRGRLTPARLQALVPDLREREIFSCGPGPYMGAVRSMLTDAGADPGRCHEESFDITGQAGPGGHTARITAPAAPSPGSELAGSELAGSELAGSAPPPAPGPASGAAPAEAAAEPPTSTSTFTVQFSRSVRTIDCDANTFVLDAALNAGLTVPSSCGQGMCGTCKSSLLEGTVEMNHAGGIRPREIAQGKFLPCCSKPTGNLVIDA